MENKSHALIAGIFTIVLLTATVLIALWFNRDRIERVPYEMATRRSISGLNPEAAVRYRGLEVGKVDEIVFDPNNPGQILVRISVSTETPITQSTYGTLGYQGVTGIAYVELEDDGSKPVKLKSTKERTARIEMRPSLLDNLQTRGLTILIQTEELVKRFNSLLNSTNQQTIFSAIEHIDQAASAIGAIPQQLQPTLVQLPAMVEQGKQTLASVSTLSKSANALTDNLNTFTTRLQAPDGTLAKLSTTVEQIGAVANKVEYDALPLTGELRSSIRMLNRTINNLNEHPQNILFGSPAPVPGPGESGFVSPAQ